MIADKDHVQPVSAGPEDNTQVKSCTAFEVVCPEPSNGKAGVQMRSSPLQLELLQGGLDSLGFFVAKCLERLQKSS